MGGSSGGSSGTREVINKSEPPEYLKPHVQSIASQAGTLSGQPFSYFPDSTVVPFAPQTRQALALMEGRAIEGSPVEDAAKAEAERTLGGEYLTAGNPHLGAVSGSIWSQVNPRVSGQFAGAGRLGGGAGQTEALSRGFTEAAAPYAYGAYESERDRMGKYSMMAPMLGATDYTDIGALSSVGAAHEDLAGRNLQEEINRFQFPQTEPWERLGLYHNIVQGLPGSTATSQQPLYSNRGAGIMGGALGGLGAAGMLGFSNPWTLAAMAGGGGLLGSFT